MNKLFLAAIALAVAADVSAQNQEALPVNPGFTPEQAAAMEAQMRSSKSSEVLYPKEPGQPSATRAAVGINGATGGRRWAGIGSTPATAMERQLMHYPKPIQEEILDLMFKPNFGMALTHLKVEVGGDNNSTAAVEPSFAHTREEMANPNFRRGGNYWLMRKARDINPGIELGALAWTQPYWVGNGAGNTNKSFFTQESAEYFLKFFEGARKEWGLEMQYFSPEQNERHPGGQKEWILNHLRPTFDKAGFQHVGFVIDHGGWPLSADYRDPEFLKQVAALGRHYVENNPKHYASKEIQDLGKPLWNAEGWSRVGEGWPLAIYFAESVARCYVDSKVTQFTTWPILAGGLPGSLYGTTGLMLANKPWSGHYQIYPTVWMTAHFNQFAPMGWKTVDGGCGGLFVESNPTFDRWTGVPMGEPNLEWKRPRLNYLTFASPDGQDYSIVVVNTSPFARTLDFEVQNLPAKALHVWRSTERDQFVHVRQVSPEGGKFTLGIEPWSVYSLTTTAGQQKGAPKHPVPVDQLLALPYSDDFDSYEIGGDARYSSCTAGYFEAAHVPGETKTLRQSVPAKGLTWSIPKDNYPCVTIGDIRWSDYEVSSDARLEGEQGDMALWARVSSFRDHGMAGYYLRVDHGGNWELGVSKNRHGPNNFYTEKPLANGKLKEFKADAWHKLAILADGNQLRASINGDLVAEVKDGTWAAGAVGFSTWAQGIQKDYEDMKSAMVIGLKYGQARFDNLLVRPVPGKLSQAEWKAAATTQHQGNEAAKAIDGDATTFWHSEYNAKGLLPQALTVDLGKAHPVKEVRVLQRQDGGRSYIIRYALYLSADGQTFTKAAEGEWEDDAAMKPVAIAPQSARFVKIEALEASAGRKSNVSIADIQILAAERN